MPESPPDDYHSEFRPTATWPVLRLRAELLARTRAFFVERGFLEVETPLLSCDIVVDRHLDPIPVRLPGMATELPDYWLQTSPEAAMKRLLAAGGSAIYQVTRSFRAGERGRLHNPEFTIVEWYRVGDTMQQGMELLAELAEVLLPELCGGESVRRRTYGQLFHEHVGVDPHGASAGELAAAAERMQVAAPVGMAAGDRDAWLDLLLVHAVEPKLVDGPPTIVYDYPASQAALAQVRPDDPPVAERFELYAAGIELANGYHELTDAAELKRRDAEANRRRAADGKSPLPGAARLSAALRGGLPDCTGVALGFDRVMMLAAGVDSIDRVLAFPLERA
jgi:lysyl-tRNA synthetase class 2